MTRESFYNPDLSYIHDNGFGGFAQQVGEELLAIFQTRGIDDGHVVDLACGSGIWARQLVDAGYTVSGIDISPAMIELARNRVPEGSFEVASFFDASLPACRVVTAMGEGLNYLYDSTNDRSGLRDLFSRVYQALQPGGIFTFDIIEPGYAEATAPPKRHFIGDDWAVLVHIFEDKTTNRLERRITAFRKKEGCYTRTDEVHHVQLYQGSLLAEDLRNIGFSAAISRSYGRFKLTNAHAVVTALKPSN